MEIEDGRKRVVIEGIRPAVDDGRFPVKRTVGDTVEVEADVFTDGHDALSAVLLYRKAVEDPDSGEEPEPWRETAMEPLVNDRWRGSFPVDRIGRWELTVEGWVDRFKSWRRDFVKRVEAGQDVTVDLEIGARLVRNAAGRARGKDAKILGGLADSLSTEGLEPGDDLGDRVELALDDELFRLVERHPNRRHATRHPRPIPLQVDRERARYSTWYEMFPRSAGPAGRHGTFRDVIERLPYVARMGFDVLYLPPIHPIGETFRKGKNNSVVAEPGDLGSPWAIGSKEGGHTAIHPELGTLEDFHALVAAAGEHGMEIALDIAFQCAPDHPWVEEHPEWFRTRPDDTIQYAENPPKKYQDIYPFDFETEAWRELWQALKEVFDYWIEQGVRIFRVDNPHTKPFAFWEWTIREIQEERPDVLFLAEAFTRPKVLYRLAKLGFTQSYNYFPWRHTQQELAEYLTELTNPPVSDLCRANLWPNTPDILTEHLQTGGRRAFVQRFVLAATLGASYGIYGPAFELAEGRPAKPGSEEYLDSEKYQIRDWNLDDPSSLKDLIALVNRARRENRALQHDRNLVFHATDSHHLLCYSKATPDHSNVVLMVVNLDPYHPQSGWVELDTEALGVAPGAPFQVHDLVTGARYMWEGASNFVQLDPHQIPAHVFRVRSRVRTEQDFDYFL